MTTFYFLPNVNLSFSFSGELMKSKQNPFKLTSQNRQLLIILAALFRDCSHLNYLKCIIAFYYDGKHLGGCNKVI